MPLSFSSFFQNQTNRELVTVVVAQFTNLEAAGNSLCLCCYLRQRPFLTFALALLISVFCGLPCLLTVGSIGRKVTVPKSGRVRVDIGPLKPVSAGTARIQVAVSDTVDLTMTDMARLEFPGLCIVDCLFSLFPALAFLSSLWLFQCTLLHQWNPLPRTAQLERSLLLRNQNPRLLPLPSQLLLLASSPLLIPLPRARLPLLPPLLLPCSLSLLPCRFKLPIAIWWSMAMEDLIFGFLPLPSTLSMMQLFI